MVEDQIFNSREFAYTFIPPSPLSSSAIVRVSHGHGLVGWGWGEERWSSWQGFDVHCLSWIRVSHGHGWVGWGVGGGEVECSDGNSLVLGLLWSRVSHGHGLIGFGAHAY